MALTNYNIFSTMKYWVLVILSVFLFSCNNESKVEKEIEKIPMDVEIIRFDKEFAHATLSDLPKLKAEFPAFFPKQYNDSIWVEKLTDTLQDQLEEEVLKLYSKDEVLNEVIVPLFQHIKYYFPNFETPLVIATTSDVDYRNKVILADNMLIIGLDNYLGADHHFYEGIDKYVSKEMKASQISPDIAETYARQYIKPPTKASFLGQIVYFGKELYLKDLWLPNISDAEKIGYTEEEYQWAEENEEYMWRYFVEKELLYSTDPKLGARFISPAPFSKFYLEIDNDSPGMLGRYLGWKIVRAYMENNDTDVQQLMVADAEEIFKNSKYKPKK
ncbi:protein involved in gliding motility GldB [Aequorivita sublithincola DSM 14238]|uniref:Protein involved in gliding motility GldB n=1 Tax=Aequorivita sublithincola (strain DSM 14238 / LMG 21431 / ACAM 643 / 9-3) TaxID=746697 RepID=I3YWH5_AEQSU|nr:gliding motility lipoprotein GldB [Aequorivita sublithincola]AFL81343.1 protein involved in gliding motility GldB [Aequorivita sublithincola DSM 14238]